MSLQNVLERSFPWQLFQSVLEFCIPPTEYSKAVFFPAERGDCDGKLISRKTLSSKDNYNYLPLLQKSKFGSFALALQLRKLKTKLCQTTTEGQAELALNNSKGILINLF